MPSPATMLHDAEGELPYVIQQRIPGPEIVCEFEKLGEVDFRPRCSRKLSVISMEVKLFTFFSVAAISATARSGSAS